MIKRSLRHVAWTSRAHRLVALFLCMSLWITGLCFPTATAEEKEKKGTVTASALIIREKPSADSEGLRTVKKGATLTILGTEGGWYKVEHGVIIGYASKTYISLSSTSSSSTPTSSSSTPSVKSNESLPKDISAIGAPPPPTREGDSGSSVKKLQQALKLKGFYNGTCDGVYGSGTVSAVKAFQKSRKLSADGIAGNATIKFLFGSTAEKSESTASKSSKAYKTEKPKWFDGGSSLISKGTVFQVKDVRSGRVFRVKRWSGSNHMDVEPYTAEDTKILKQCYGGTFSWNRRPVLVMSNNRVFAGSMNGMPHGTQTIKNNGFEGHICIHFAGSKTHGTDVVDPDHQAAVKEAANATW